MSYLPITPEQVKELIFASGLVKEADWADAADNAARRRRGVEEVLIERDFITEQYLFEAIGDLLKVPFVNLRKRKLEAPVLAELSADVVTKAKAIPFEANETELKVAFVNPADQTALQTVQQATKKKVVPFLTTIKGYRFAARLYDKDIKGRLGEILNTKLSKDEVQGPNHVLEIPIIKIVDTILEYAMFELASDIHIEALPDAVVVRFRVDGELKDEVELPSTVHDALVARIKILANLRIDEHRVPQDGRFSFKLEEEEESVRVSVIPAFYGEKIVMRMMTGEAQNLNLEDLGFTQKNMETLRRQIDKPFGMILVVGPTGSGKTTTLYSVLNILNTEDVNISTIEDPIEYGVRRVNQTQVNTAAGYDFASGLRSLLRQDPDIIMIGEIRDNETAQIAVRAALTGHLVLSTLHTNNASGVPPRLLDMEVESFLVASTLNLVIAQRLVRKICTDCIESYHLTPDRLLSLGKEFDLEKMMARFKTLNLVEPTANTFADLTFYRGRGCTRCHTTGYSGRIGVMELLENTAPMQEAITRHASTNDIEKIAFESGMINIFEDGLQKALLGVTTIEEVLRIKRE
jgi:type IV pilus assembly protein PilB